MHEVLLRAYAAFASDAEEVSKGILGDVLKHPDCSVVL